MAACCSIVAALASAADAFCLAAVAATSLAARFFRSSGVTGIGCLGVNAGASTSECGSVEDHKRRHLGGGILQGHRSLQPRLAVDAFHHSPGHLVFQEVHVLTGGNLNLLPIPDD